MADDTPLVLPEQGQPSGEAGVWDDLVVAAFRELEDRVNELRQYVLDNPGGGGASDATIAALVADTNSALYAAVLNVVLTQGFTPSITAASLTDVTLSNIQAFLTAATIDEALTALGVLSSTAVTSALSGKASLVHTHVATDVSGLAAVATSNDYTDLINKPTIPGAGIATAAPGQVFFRSWTGTEWEPRGSARDDVLVLFLANGSGQPLPADAIDGLDMLLS